jgi:hypothetical protein
VAGHELPEPVTGGGRAREHRLTREIASDVSRQLVHRTVALSRLLLERFENDRVEVAGEVAPEALGI